MNCPSVYIHPEFEKSYNVSDKKQKKEYEKLVRYLKSDTGDCIGEQLKHELSPFKSFPRGHVNLRCLFVLCKDCKKEVIDKKKCGFCNNKDHTMNDAVLIFMASHDKAYKKGKKIIEELK